MLINTTLCYLIRNGKYLMLHRTKKEGDINKDKWIGVGGKLEERESPVDCVKREVLEETGYEMQSQSFRGIVTFIYRDVTEYMYLFTSENFIGQEKICDEGDLEWIDCSAVYDLPIWEGDKAFFRLLEKDSGFFTMKLVYDDEGNLLDTVVQ